MTVIVFQLKGSDATVQDGIRTISQAIEAMVKPARTVVAQPAAIPAKREGSALPPAKEIEEAIEVETEEQVASAPPKSRGPRKYRAPQVIELELGKGALPLKKFLEQKQPGDSDTRRFIVCAVWLKENLSINEVSIDHIHTCYRHMSWQTPKHPQVTLDNLKRKNQWFSRDQRRVLMPSTTWGENQVMQMGTEQK